MNLSVHSKNKLLNQFSLYDIPKVFSDPIFNYLVYGYSPGSFWSAVLKNDFLSAMVSSHPSNSIVELKRVANFIKYCLREDVTHGSDDAVHNWLNKTSDERRTVLEQLQLIYTKKMEVVLMLKDEPTVTPILN